MRSLFRYQPPNPQQKCHPDRSAAQWRDLLFIIRGNESEWTRRRPLCHPDRSVAQWRDPLFITRGNESEWKRRRPLCHPDRSVAQWRDLQLSGFILEMFFCPVAEWICAVLLPGPPNLFRENN